MKPKLDTYCYALFLAICATAILLTPNHPSHAVDQGCCEVNSIPPSETTIYSNLTQTECEVQNSDEVDAEFHADQMVGEDGKSCVDKKTTKVFSGPSEIIPPVLSVSIPGFGKFSEVECNEPGVPCAIPWLSEYIKALYNYSLIIIGVIAVVIVMLGGIMWLSAAGNRQRIGEAMKLVKSGVMGVIFIACSYTLLFLINPNLIILSPINIGYIDRLDLDIMDSPDAGNSNGLPPGEPDPQCLQKGGLNDLNKIAQIYDDNKVVYRYGATGGDCTVRESGKECKCPAGQLCFDCSNFIRHILSCVGKTGPSGTTSDIFAGAEVITTATSTTVNGKNINPGDLLGWPKKSSGGNTGHVVLYIGNGQIVESHGGSGRKADSVRISKWEDYYNKYHGSKTMYINRGK